MQRVSKYCFDKHVQRNMFRIALRRLFRYLCLSRKNIKFQYQTKNQMISQVELLPWQSSSVCLYVFWFEKWWKKTTNVFEWNNSPTFRIIHWVEWWRECEAKNVLFTQWYDSVCVPFMKPFIDDIINWSFEYVFISFSSFVAGQTKRNMPLDAFCFTMPFNRNHK